MLFLRPLTGKSFVTASQELSTRSALTVSCFCTTINFDDDFHQGLTLIGLVVQCSVLPCFELKVTIGVSE